MRLLLVRHGQTEWNVTNRAQGHIDIELDATGHQQARALAPFLAQFEIQRVLSSDLKRCQQTIAPFLQKSPLEVQLREDLRERTFGEMEGQIYTELHQWMRGEAERLGVPEHEVRPTGGESMADVWKRLDQVEGDIFAESRTTLVVSHGGALAQLLSKIIRGSNETPRAFRFSNCGVTILGRRPDGSFLLEKFHFR